MSRQRRGQPLWTLLRAGVWALATHVLVLALALGVLPGLWPGLARPGALPEVPELRIPGTGDPDPDEAPPWIALEALEPGPAIPELPPLDPAAELPEADLANQDLRPAAGSQGIVGQREAPATDQGDGGGRQLPLAWRRDGSTLRSRLTTGARDYQPSHEKTASRASSPQALRRERRTGVGDSARTEQPRLTAAVPATPPPLPVELAEKDEPQPVLDQHRRTPTYPGADTMRGEGPLDADVGSRAFDVPDEGPARDFLAARAVSDELHPGITDYATVAARGRDLEGQGAGAAPGVTSVAGEGQASSFAGWPRPRPGDDGEGTRERLYAREHLEIRRRVARVLRFPRRLALELEQGEAIVQFQVERNGRVGGDVKLVKSAGFQEFDQEAVDVVRRAAPFPQLPAPLLVRIRIPFDNPLVR